MRGWPAEQELVEMMVAGVRVRVPRSEAWHWRQAASGTWEPATLSALQALISPGDVVLDVGAYVGVVTLVAAGLGARVHAFEPDPVARARLEKTLAVNPEIENRIRVHPEALGTADGTGRMASEHLGDSGARLVSARVDGATVKVRDAAFLDTEAELDRCVLVKLDTEGAEYALLPRMRPFLRRVRPAMLVSTHTYHYREQLLHLPRLVRGVVYRLWALPAQARLLLRVRRLGEMLVPAAGGASWQPLTLGRFGRLLATTGEKEFLIVPRGRSSRSRPVAGETLVSAGI